MRQVGAPVEVWVDALSGTTTYRNDLEVDRGMHFQVLGAELGAMIDTCVFGRALCAALDGIHRAIMPNNINT